MPVFDIKIVALMFPGIGALRDPAEGSAYIIIFVRGNFLYAALRIRSFTVLRRRCFTPGCVVWCTW